MSQPYIGEIRMFAGSFPPNGWAFCDGQLMPISENDALFVVIGTTYGGDGQETFALPNLQSRVPMHKGTGSDGISYLIGETGGVESVTLTTQQIPSHTHAPLASSAAGNAPSPTDAIWSVAGTGEQLYSGPPNPPAGTMRANVIQVAGGNSPHENMGPYLVISFIISLFGIFPAPP
jgi:microcystin-dependent protein